ncbi:MAG: c-type cytochrome [Myxococcales bacterium]|nr:c-type cytochrome [Myxococcales bacterium]
MRALTRLLCCGAALAAVGCDDTPDEAAPVVWMAGGDTTNALLGGRNAFIKPATNISPDDEALFYAGNSFFNQAWVEAPASTGRRDGLGPLFNARSCAACHLRDGRGAPPATSDEPFLGLLLRLSVPGTDAVGGPAPDPVYGGQLQPFALPDVAAEASPRVTWATVEGAYADGTPYTLAAPTYHLDDPAYGPFADDLRVSPRVAPQIIGLGLLEAIPDARLEALADPDDADGDGISGRPNRVWDVTHAALRIGRFGWKGDQPSVRQQVAGAFLGDMGITSPVFPEGECTDAQADCKARPRGSETGDSATDIDPDAFERTVLYSRMLAVPIRRKADDPQVRRGGALFTEAGCAACHVPDHRTAKDAEPAALADQHIWPYTDLLLHDMGPELSDERPVFVAEGREWRTPPLWGVGLFQAVNGHTRLLHDGRADGVAEAILWHGGEGEAAREAFRAMSAEERAALVAFVESL